MIPKINHNIINQLISKRLIPYLCLSVFVGTLCFYSCKSPETQTKRLFMQSKRANLEIPASSLDSTGQSVLVEQVSYQHQDNQYRIVEEQDSINRVSASINEVQQLNQVTVTAQLKQKFAPERDGKVDVDFIVRVPKELLSDNWQVHLSPRLLANDSVVQLKSLVIKGKDFVSKLQNDSLAFEAYQNSIIDASAYDSLFLDRAAIAKGLNKRQRHYWNLYQKEYQQVHNYFEWKHKMQQRYNLFNAKMQGNRLGLYHKYMLDKEEKSIRLQAIGADTVGLGEQYTKKYQKRTKLLPAYHMERELSLSKVPGKYKHFFLNEPSIDNLDNNSTTEHDSIQIAKHSYFYDKIAENEQKDKDRERVKKRLIPLSEIDNVRLDSIVDNTSDFVYYYRQQYPVEAGLSRLRIAMTGKITATDLSVYNLPKADTLNYIISSLVQLVDTSLIIKKTKLYRNMYDQMTIHPQFEANKSIFKVGYMDNQQQVDTLMNRYMHLTEGMGLRMDSLIITSRSSLDGSYESNYELSRKRALAIQNYLEANYSQIPNGVIRTIAKGEDWQGFANLLKTRDDIANKDSILSMITHAVYPDQTEKDIKSRYKSDYNIIQKHIYPQLRAMDISFHVSRAEMTSNEAIQEEEKEGYAEGLDLLQNRQYWEAIEILKDYPDYNTALCLACMGYNGKAYDILTDLPQTANNEYLLAIVSSRMDKKDQAVNHLLKSIELNPDKSARIELDSEIINLVNEYNLRGKIRQLESSFDYTQVYSDEEESTSDESTSDESSSDE